MLLKLEKMHRATKSMSGAEASNSRLSIEHAVHNSGSLTDCYFCFPNAAKDPASTSMDLT
jgi:hypothetical protein